MEFIKSWKFMAIILAVLAVVSIAGVIYGVATHQEAGLMEGFEPWPQTPVRVCVSSYAIQPRAESADLENASYVVGVINRRVGLDLLSIVDPTAPHPGVRDCNIILTYGVPHEVVLDPPSRNRWTVVDEGGAAEFRDGYCMAATTNVFGEVQTLVVMHELGHCLGLAHDDFDPSIMRPVQRPTPDRTIPPWISDHDRELLRGIYGGT